MTEPLRISALAEEGTRWSSSRLSGAEVPPAVSAVRVTLPICTPR